MTIIHIFLMIFLQKKRPGKYLLPQSSRCHNQTLKWASNYMLRTAELFPRHVQVTENHYELFSPLRGNNAPWKVIYNKKILRLKTLKKEY